MAVSHLSLWKLLRKSHRRHGSDLTARMDSFEYGALIRRYIYISIRRLPTMGWMTIDHTPYFHHGTYDMFLFLCVLEFDSWCVLSLDLLADICRRRRSWAQIQATQFPVKNAAGVAQCRDLYCWGYTARYPFFDIFWPLWDSELVKDPLKDESQKAPQLGSLEPRLSLWVGGFASYESMAFLFAPLMATGQANRRYWKLSGSQHVLLSLR